MIPSEPKAIAALKTIQEKVNEQSEDEDLWFPIDKYGQAGLLQKQLRELHDVIERFTIPMFEKVGLDTET